MASSNIIGASFEDYVKKQIKIRQEKLGLGLKEQEVFQFVNSNAPFIRLTSGVNVDSNILTQLNLQNNPLYNSNGLAAYNKLYGGRSIYVENYDPKNPSNSTGKIDTLTGGYGYYDGSIGQYPSSYGFYSNADYGLVPPPGIKSIDIKAMNRGSLREATIQIQCHNLQQFQIIEILYMRLKYSILLEWGHSVYFDNSGNFLPTSTWDLSNIFIKGTVTQQEMLELVEKNREGSDGNYDAFFGLVTNFTWTLRPDGGYDITVIARSTGDVIESLKINTNYPATTAIPTAPTNTSLLSANSQKTTINKILNSITTQVYAGRGYAHGVDDGNAYANASGVGTAQTPIHNANLEWMANVKSVFNRNVNYSRANDHLVYNEAWAFNYAALSGGTNNLQYYVKLGTLMRILESFLLVYDSSKGTDKFRPPLFKIDYNYNTNHCFTFPRHCSLDPKVCLIPIDKAVTGSGALSGYAYVDKTYDFIEIYDVDDNTGASVYSVNYSTVTADSLKYGPIFGSNVIVNQITPQSTTTPPGSSISVYNYSSAGTSGPPALEANKNDILGYGTDAAKAQQSLESIINFRNTPTQNVAIVDGQEYIVQYQRAYQEIGEKYFDLNPNNVDPNAIGNRQFSGFKEIDRQTYFNLKNSRRSSYPNYNFYASYDIAHKRAFYSRVTTRIYYDLSSNYSPPASGGTGVYEYLKDTGFKTPKEKNSPDGIEFRGNTMHMYVNLECIASILDKEVNLATGEISLYNFLDTLMKRIQSALGNVNNFEVIYNEDNNSYRIIDNTFIPGTINSNNDRFKIVSFNANILRPNYGSFVENVNFKTKLSNNFATMTTIGAQKNGNVVGSNSTALSKWNNGLTDRIIERKDNTNADTEKNIETIYKENIIYLKEFNRKVNDTSLVDADISNIKGSIGDLFNTEIGEFTNKGDIPGIGFIPFDLELTMLGLSGPRIYESYTIDTTLLPDVYKNKIQFICSGVSHHVDENGWKTTLNSICGPRYEGVKISNPANTSNIAAAPVVVNTTPVKSDWKKPASFLGASDTAFVGKDWKKYNIDDVVQKIQANATLKTDVFENYLRTVLRAIKNDPNIEEVEDAAYFLATGKHEANFSLIRWESDYLCVKVGQAYPPPTPAGVANNTNGPCASAKNYYKSTSGGKSDYYYHNGVYEVDKNGLPYFGRGFIQLTWKSGYDKYGKIIGVDLVSDPEVMFTSDEVAYNVAVAYMVTRKTFKWARLGDKTKARKTVNGNGVDEVWSKYVLLKPILENALKNP